MTRVLALILALATALTSQEKTPERDTTAAQSAHRVVDTIADWGMMFQPRFEDGNQLVRPQEYREWMFVGSNLNMGYSDAAAPTESRFHNIYIQPEAYRQYAHTGKFPNKTMLVMEVIAAGTNASINKKGQFEDRPIGIEVSVKDEKRFPGKWAYFNFIGSGGTPLPQAKPFPKEACWNCHNQHGAADNVFVQFYPVLREAQPKP